MLCLTTKTRDPLPTTPKGGVFNHEIHEKTRKILNSQNSLFAQPVHYTPFPYITGKGQGIGSPSHLLNLFH